MKEFLNWLYHEFFDNPFYWPQNEDEIDTESETSSESETLKKNRNYWFLLLRLLIICFWIF